MRRLTILLGLTLLFFSVAMPQERITPSEAAKYVGKRAIVCGKVASANFAARSRGRPTFLNLDCPYPNQIFTVMIWGQNRNKFEVGPERAYRGKKICVTGTIGSYRGMPQMEVNDPSQIRAEE